MSGWIDGLPPSAHDRIARQRVSGTRGSLLSSPAVAALQAAGLEPVGEVFGCMVMNLGWQQGYCGAYSMAAGPFGGFGGGGLGGGFGPSTAGWTTPVLTSGQSGSSGFGPYVQAYETGWYGAASRMVTEAKALGAEGVVGVVHGRARLESTGWEYTALGTAVRATDPVMAASPFVRGDVWTSNLGAEDTAAAIRSGHMPLGIALGLSVSTKHEDWYLRQQESIWAGNVEIQGMTELISAARHDARERITARARRFGGGGDLVITASGLGEFESQCRSSGRNEPETDLHAEAVFVGTVLSPASAARRHAHREGARVLSVLPLTDRTSRP